MRALATTIAVLALVGVSAVAQPARPPSGQHCAPHKQRLRPPDATAVCRDGSYSTSRSASACTAHCGVLRWIKRQHHA